MSAEPSTSTRPAPVPAVTVADEADEIMAESSTSTSVAVPPATTSTSEIKPEAKEGVEGDGEVKQDDDEAKEEKKKEVDPNAIPEDACVTLYLQNLNEHVRIPVMKQTLLNLFKPYRPNTEVTAHKNVRMRGQAFMTFPNVEMANKARKEVGEFPLYGKPVQIRFAKMRSDVAVKKESGAEGLEEFKKERLLHKRKTRRNNLWRQKQADKLKQDAEGGDGPSASKRQKTAQVQMPDEYLPPNNILFIQNLPDGTTQDDLREVFEVHAGLVEIRTIPAKKDIAFVEYADEGSATVAKDALHNFKIDGETKMKVTYARK